jgi:threonine aldolase
MKQKLQLKQFYLTLKENEILAVQFGKHQIRFVTHLDVTKEMIEKVCEVLVSFK